MTCRAAHQSPRFRAAPVLVTFAAFVWAASCTPAAAQLIEGADLGRSYRGVFGGAAAEPSNRPQSLDFTGSFFGGYDDDIFARGQGPRAPNAQVSGLFVGSQFATAYQHRFTTSTFTANGASALRWLPSTDELYPTFYSAAAAYSTALGPRGNIALRHVTAYRPFFSVVPFPGGATVGPSLQDPSATFEPGEMGAQGPDDFTVSADQDALSHFSSVQMGRQLTPRSSIQFRGGYGITDFRSSEFDDLNNSRWSAGGGYSYQLTRFASARLGYGYRSFATRDGNTSGNHDIQVGINYNQPFVFQRGRTQFSFTTGTALVVTDRLDVEGDSGQRTVFRATGTAGLLHAFRAPWQAQMTYVRSVSFLDGLSEPYQGDQVMAGVGGLLTSRIDLSMSAAYMSGAIGLSERNFDTALGNVRLRAALTQKLALFAQYFYYQYSFADDIAEQLIVAPELERQGFRAGLTLWLPLIR